MAERRGISLDFVYIPEFSELDTNTKLLYFYINMDADDFGFTNKIRKAILLSETKDENLQKLIDKGFLYKFDSGVYVLLHWRMNNWLRSDRCKTIYEEELSMLSLDEKTGIYKINEKTKQTCFDKTPKKNYVYLIRNGEYTKIGFSSDVDNRLSAIKTAAPLAYIYALKETVSPRQEEQYYQIMFKNKQLQREWFELDEKDFEFLLKDGFKLVDNN